MRTWMKKGHPRAYWLSGFFFPHGFVTGVLQAYARKHQKAIDFLKFRFSCLDLRAEREIERRKRQETKADVLDAAAACSHQHRDINDEDLIARAAADGVYVYGLFIESAAWSEEKGCITEQRPGAIISPMPIVHFQPFEAKHKAVKQNYY